MTKKSASLVVVAAGNSSRMGSAGNKQFLLLEGQPILAHTLQAFDFLPEISEIIVVTREEDILLVNDLVRDYDIRKVKAVIPGGTTRQESVVCGLHEVHEGRVLIHDGARPFVTEEEIYRVLDALDDYDAAIPGVPVKDTVKRVNSQGEVAETLHREELIAVLTPQGFVTERILAAHTRAKADGVVVTDDASVAEYAGIPVKLVPGTYQNIKITTPEDMVLAEAILGAR
ncbi:MAG: 2-C-methyl-D-erythritol 4-phosphate cytidylyltransferase [Clostridia bacterium]|nr:2-C-methyl-D-erythritol 4-phosphate cytidylyltransferase [Clostridia bacterium]